MYPYTSRDKYTITNFGKHYQKLKTWGDRQEQLNRQFDTGNLTPSQRKKYRKQVALINKKTRLYVDELRKIYANLTTAKKQKIRKRYKSYFYR